MTRKGKIILNPDAQNLNLKAPHTILATWFYSGLLLPAPGTWGSLASIPFGLLILWVLGKGGLFIAIIAIFTIGLWASHQFSKATGTQDSKMIVIDETVGMWIALFIAGTDPILVPIAFAAFRLFDIVKIWPANIFDQHFKNAFGVMMDDVFAGLYAAIVIIFLKSFFGL